MFSFLSSLSLFTINVTRQVWLYLHNSNIEIVELWYNVVRRRDFISHCHGIGVKTPCFFLNAANLFNYDSFSCVQKNKWHQTTLHPLDFDLKLIINNRPTRVVFTLPTCRLSARVEGVNPNRTVAPGHAFSALY